MQIELKGPRTIIPARRRAGNDFTEGMPVPPRELDYEPIRGPRLKVGYIGIQNHHEPQTVQFREISVVR